MLKGFRVFRSEYGVPRVDLCLRMMRFALDRCANRLHTHRFCRRYGIRINFGEDGFDLDQGIEWSTGPFGAGNEVPDLTGVAGLRGHRDP